MSVLKRHASYLEKPLFIPNQILKEMRVTMKGVKYDTLIGTGLSGALIVPYLARALKKYYAIIRKANDATHSYSGKVLEGRLGSRWLFVDDLIDSGATYNRVKKAVAAVATMDQHTTVHVGTYLYYNDKYIGADE